LWGGSAREKGEERLWVCLWSRYSHARTKEGRFGVLARHARVTVAKNAGGRGKKGDRKVLVVDGKDVKFGLLHSSPETAWKALWGFNWVAYAMATL